MNEFDFIKRLREQARTRKHSSRLIIGVGDDGAVIRQRPGHDLIVTTDLLIEGIDFFRHASPPTFLGHKALAVSLSDVAAMGGRPFWAFVSLGMPRNVWNDPFRDKFITGYFALADKYGVTLAGGDVSETKQGVVIDSIVLGEVVSRNAISRAGARVGDQIFVTGTLGGAAAGLKLIEKGARITQESGAGSQELERGSSPTVRDGVSEPPAVAGGPIQMSDEDQSIQSLLLRQLRPTPRVGWGIVIGEERLATSMIDISDGLSSDLHHLCEESNAGALIDASSIPLDDDVKRLCGRRALDPLALALHGGEDFELLFTVAPVNIPRLPRTVDGIAISNIGEVTATPGVISLKEKRQVWKLEPQGFEHFGSPPFEGH